MLFTMRETYVDRNPKSHKVLGIAPATIIDRQLPFEYTITSRSTDVVVMAQPVQNINHSAFRSMFEREKLSGNNFNDWFRQLKLVLRVEKKMFVIEQPLPAAPAANSVANVLVEWNAIYDAYNEVVCLILEVSVSPSNLYLRFTHFCSLEDLLLMRRTSVAVLLPFYPVTIFIQFPIGRFSNRIRQVYTREASSAVFGRRVGNSGPQSSSGWGGRDQRGGGVGGWGVGGGGGGTAGGGGFHSCVICEDLKLVRDNSFS
ncbi:hypothetical protein Tco_0339816 [Tanacetum coccineum]